MLGFFGLHGARPAHRRQLPLSLARARIALAIDLLTPMLAADFNIKPMLIAITRTRSARRFGVLQPSQSPGRGNGSTRSLMVALALGFVCGGWGLAAPPQSVSDSKLPETDFGEAQAAFMGVGPWIWAPEMRDKQTCRLWRSFEIPSGAAVKSARLRIAVDNGYRLMLDGRELGTGSDWRSITEYDVSMLLGSGRHVLAVEAFNDNREAGMQFGLRIGLKDGRVIEILSDPTWRVAPQTEEDWEWKRQAPARWVKAVMVSSLLPRATEWLERTPTMVVKVPLLRPVELHFWQRGWFQVTLWGIVAVIGLLYLRLMARLALQSRAQDLLRTERARIARDIHDELGARLTELALEGEVIQTELPAESPVRPRLEALCEKARAVSGAMDEVVWMVNSQRDTVRDFAAYVCKHAQRYLTSTPIRCRLDVEAELPEVVFELPIRRNLLLGVKEALNNAVKYSQATELFLRIRLRGQTLFVVVEDDGAGFDLENADPVRNGLTNMKHRMKELGGECRIVTSAGAGCLVEFQVPLPKFSKPADLSNVHENQSLAGISGRAVTSGGKEVSPQ